jgi:multiple sugar transport system permease protein
MSFVAVERAGDPDNAVKAARAAQGPQGRRRRPSAWHLLLLPVALLMIFPFVWLVITSASTLEETRTFPPSLPDGFPVTWLVNMAHNYGDAWTQAPFGHWALNTAIVTIVVVLGNLVFCSLAGYALARLRFFGRTALFLVILATLMVPFQVVMIPVLLICRGLGIVDTLPALILPNLVTPFGIFLLRQFLKTLPIEIEEAARIDGATRLGTLFKVLLPSMGAPLATVGIMTMLWSWNDFLWPLIAITSEDTMTLQLGLSSFVGSHTTNWPVLMAGTVMTQLPMLLIFLVAQRWFVQSFAASGVKG